MQDRSNHPVPNIVSRSTSKQKTAGTEVNGAETEQPRFRSYFDLLEAKYADDSTPPPAYEPPPQTATSDQGDPHPGQKAPAEHQIPVRHPTAPVILEGRSEENPAGLRPSAPRGPRSPRRSNQKFWILGLLAAVMLVLLGALYWSRPQGPSASSNAASTVASSEASTEPSPDSSSTPPILRPSENSGSADEPASDPSGDDPPAIDELDTSEDPTTWVEELPPESAPISITFPELDPSDEVVSEPTGGSTPGPATDVRTVSGTDDSSGEVSATTSPSATPDPLADVSSPPPPAESQAAEAGAAESVESEPVVASNPSFEPPQKVFSPQPTYPEASRQAREQGTVVLEGTISADGYVSSAWVRRSATPALDRAALKTFRTWQFQPALRDNIPVESSYRLAFRFSLEDPPSDLNTPVTAPAGSSTPDEAGSTAPPTSAQSDSSVAEASAKGTPDDPLPWRGDFTPPSRFVSPLPTYPQSAWATGVQGTVTLEVVVDTDGRVGQVEVLEGLPHGISEAAVAAVQRWRFRPATRDGEPVVVFHRLTLRFAP